MLDFSVTFFISLLNIGILFFVLRAILFKPVTRFIENRKLKIKADLEQASKEKDRAEELRAHYEDMLRKVEEEGDRIIAEARDAARKQAATLIERAQAEAEDLIRAARRQTEEERAGEMDRFKKQAAAIVVTATGRLLRRSLVAEDDRTAAAALVSELGME